MTTENDALVRDFCAAFARRNVDELLGFFTEDAIYHNMPLAPVQGKTGIRKVLEMFLSPAQAVEFAILNLASSGAVVLTERLDTFSIGGRTVALPIAGVFEVVEGKIAGWRDYFDMATWTKQATAAAG